MQQKISDFLVQAALAVLGGTAIILLAQDNRWGFVAGAASQPFWFITSIKNRQWGIVALSTVYAASWLYGIQKHFF